MSGLIGKASKFLRSPQGQKAVAKAKDFAGSEEGKQKIEGIKQKVTGKEEQPAPKPQPAAKATPAAPPKPAAQATPQPDPGAPGNPAA